MLPLISTIAPNSPTARPNASADAGEDRRAQRGQDDPAERVDRAGAERGGGLLGLAVEAISTGWTARTTNGSVTNSSASADAGLRVGHVDADRAGRAVEGEQRQAGDDRRQRERQVDQRVDERLAAELVADEHPRDQHAHHGVDRGDDERHDQRQPHRGDRLGVGDRVPERADAAVERAHDDGGQREQDDQGQPGGAEPADDERPAARCSARPRRACGSRACPAPLRRHLAVETPRSCSILATEPVSGSKNSALTLSQPPNLSISNSDFGVG